MAIQSQPSRISEPFAGSGSKNVIPATNATPSASQAASWASGFPPECSQPISAGGCPVPRNDVNGVLNWLSQGFAFHQDGGVWEWSALADYDTQRMVRGSDGKIYWSVAQSGPSIAAGAQDPTTDDGTYWGPISMKSPGVLDRSDKLATTQWVQDAFGPAPIYVDAANGSDSNDGLTIGTAVQTISHALQMGFDRTGQAALIYIAAGTYTENIVLSQKSVSVTLLGNVALNGYINLTNSSFVVEESTYTFSISNSDTSAPLGSLGAYRGSIALFKCPVSISVNALVSAISSYVVSVVYFSSTLSISLSGGDRVFGCHDCSSMVFGDAVSIAGTCDSHLIDNFNSSSMYFAGSFSCSNGVLASSQVPIRCRSNSSISFAGAFELYYSVNSADYLIYIYINSSVRFSGATKLYFKPASGVSVVYASSNSNVSFDGASLSIEFSNVSDSIRVLKCSSIIIGTASLDFSGAASLSTVTVGRNAYFEIGYATTVTGTVTGARRYTVSMAGVLNVEGAGENRIPGASAGYVNTAAFGYYG